MRPCDDDMHLWEPHDVRHLSHVSGLLLTYRCVVCHQFYSRQLPYSMVRRHMTAADLKYMDDTRDYSPLHRAFPPTGPYRIGMQNAHPVADRGMQNAAGPQIVKVSKAELAEHYPREGYWERLPPKPQLMKMPWHEHKFGAKCAAEGCEECVARSAELDAAMNAYRDQPLRSL